MSEHLNEDEVSAVVMSRLDISPDGGIERIAYRVFGHLTQCENCRRDVAALRAIITGDPVDDQDESGVSLAGYRVVPFVLSVPAIPPVESWSEPSLAAQTDSVLERLPAFNASRMLRSEDGGVDLTVTENLRDDTCRVYVKAKGEIERSEVSFFLPPGVICAWPTRSYFEYPRFAFRAVDWTQTKLLYAVRPS
jgi:hypothetical protein